MNSFFLLILTSSVLLSASLSGVGISSYVIINDMTSYQEHNCSNLTDVTIHNVFADHYQCSGYADVHNYDSSVLVKYPPFNTLFVKVSKYDCINWMNTYQNLDTFTCYVHDVSRRCTDGYINKGYITFFIAVLVVLSVFSCLLISGIIISCVRNKRSRTRTNK